MKESRGYVYWLQLSLTEWWETAKGSLSCNGFVLLMFLPYFILAFPVHLLFYPFYLAWMERRAARGYTPVGKGLGLPLYILFSVAAVGALWIPFLIVKNAEGRFQTDRLCLVCGTPGNVVWYSGEGPGRVGKVYCTEHEAEAPPTESVSSDLKSDRIDTPAGEMVMVMVIGHLVLLGVFIGTIPGLKVVEYGTIEGRAAYFRANTVMLLFSIVTAYLTLSGYAEWLKPPS
jgi:hypothetical protein